MSTQPLVLVADDEPRITKLVAIALSEEGFRVVTANGGEQALQKAEEVRPDIVLLDIVMPDLDGAGVIKFDDVEIDLERRMVTRGGELVQLSRTEWLLLQHLAANAGKVVLHTELLTKVWGPEYRDDLQYLRVWVSRVRRKLGAEPGEPGRIKTFQGIGYLLDTEGAAESSEPEPVVEVEPARASALIG